MGGRGARYKTLGNPEGPSIPNTDDLPARMNHLYNGNKQNFGHTLDVFREEHANDTSQEHMIISDINGFVSYYGHGQSDYVVPPAGDYSGKYVIHNHPNNSTFSTSDMLWLWENNATGIIAVGQTQDYILTKTKRFKGREFARIARKTQLQSNGETIKTLSDPVLQQRAGFTFRIRRKSR